MKPPHLFWMASLLTAEGCPIYFNTEDSYK